ncbi:MAG: right-handed parallel beta-helix repeat-containing protein, partial [candidate division Zixibacteria bacterium]|nr:right-handed parallel beta-helix repeat-containing protein [candidate division Zixibacteria bacterium]
NIAGGLFFREPLSAGTISGCIISNNGPFGIHCVNNASPNIIGNTISDHLGSIARDDTLPAAGLVIGYSAYPTIRDNIFENNQYPIRYEHNASADIDNSNQYIDNIHNAVYVESWEWDAESDTLIWMNPGIPYYFTSTYDLHFIDDVVFIDPGVIFKFQAPASDTGAVVEIIVERSLIARGTAENPIYFTSARDDSIGDDTDGSGRSSGQPGDWGCIHFYGSSADNVLEHCVLRYGGQGHDYETYRGVLEIASGSTTVNRCTITRNIWEGIYLAFWDLEELPESNVIVENSQIYDNGGFGIIMEADSYEPLAGLVTPLIDNCIVSDNIAGGLFFREPLSAGTISSCTISNNGPFGIRCDSFSSPSIFGNTISDHLDSPAREDTLPAAGLVNGYSVYPTIRDNTFENNQYPIRYEHNASADIDNSNQYQNNIHNGIYVESWEWDAESDTLTWMNPGIPYYFTSTYDLHFIDDV